MTFLMPDSWYHPPEPHECDDDGCDGGLCEEDAADAADDAAIERAEAERDARDQENREHYERLGEL